MVDFLDLPAGHRTNRTQNGATSRRRDPFGDFGGFGGFSFSHSFGGGFDDDPFFSNGSRCAFSFFLIEVFFYVTRNILFILSVAVWANGFIFKCFSDILQNICELEKFIETAAFLFLATKL